MDPLKRYSPVRGDCCLRFDTTTLDAKLLAGAQEPSVEQILERDARRSRHHAHPHLARSPEEQLGREDLTLTMSMDSDFTPDSVRRTSSPHETLGAS